MKKKMLPALLLLAGLSTAALAACDHTHDWQWKDADGTHWEECSCGEKRNEGAHVDENSDGKCDDCGADVHVHDYTWASDAVNHWHECSCGDKSDEAAPHVDLKNNETEAGIPDFKCDECGAEATVRFNMLGHGKAPANQYVALGGKATAPDTPDDDDAFKFGGWYKDRNCTQSFNFETESIDAVTFIYAKWTEDTTPGASRKHAYVLTMENESLQKAEKGKTIIFKFTAATDGRYTVGQASGANSENSTFTTTLTGDTVYGKDKDASEVTFDMEKDQTVYVMFTYLGENGEDVTAGVLLRETTDEPLPEGYFLDGEYFGKNYTFEINRTAKEINYEGTNYPFRYLGGSFDHIYFNVTVESRTSLYTIKHRADGKYELIIENAGSLDHPVLQYFVPQDPVALNKLFGYYEPKENATDGITKLYIYTSDLSTATSVLYKQNGVYRDLPEDATYNTEKNRLTFGQSLVTLVLADDGSVEGLDIGGNLYVKKGETGEVPPELGLEDNKEYFGEDLAIRTLYGSLYFGAEGFDKITVLSFADGKFYVAVDVNNTEVDYKLEVAEDKNTIKVYSPTGTLLDTLTLFSYIYHDLPTSDTVSLAATDFQKDLIYLYKVKTEGWYAFNEVPTGVSIYYNLNSNDPLMDYEYEGTLVGTESVWLTEDCIVGVFMETPAAVSFTVAPGQLPVGWTQSNPKIVTDAPASISGIWADTTYYFKAAAPEAGDWWIHAYYDNGDFYNGDFNIKFTVNGTEYDFSSNYTTTDARGTVHAPSAGAECLITVTTSASCNKKSITVFVTEDFETGATEVTLTGTPSDDNLTVSGSAQSDKWYKLAMKGSPLTVTGTAAFTVNFPNGTPVTATENNGTYTAQVPVRTDLYFKVVSATEQTVTLSQTFAKGSQGYPITASAEAGSNTLTVARGGSVSFTLPAGYYSIASTSDVLLVNGETELTLDTVFEVKEGDVLSFAYSPRGTDDNATITISTAEKPAETVTYEGKLTNAGGDTTYNVKVEITGNTVTYWIDTGSGLTIDAPKADLTKNSDGSYSFQNSYGDTHTFTMADNGSTITFTDGYYTVTGTLVNMKPVTYEGELTNAGGDTTYNVKVEITGNTVTYWIDTGDGLAIDAPKADLTKNGDGSYSFQNSYGDTHTFTMADDGSAITFTDGYYTVTGTLTKQA